MPLNVQNVSPRPTPSILPPSLRPLAGRLIVEKLDSLGEADGRIVPRELVCAHSQVERVNLGLDCSRRANWGKSAERRLGDADTRVAAPAAPGRACSALARNYLPEEVRDREDHLSWKPASRTLLIPFLPREECLDLTPRLLAKSPEALEALNAEYLCSRDSFRPRSRGAQGRKPLLINEHLGNI